MPRDCNCAGGCVPQPDGVADGVTRREFITLVGAGAAGAMLGGPAWAEWVAKQAPADELAKWKAELFAASAPRVYHSDVHTDARMHLGGLGTGNFEIGADGRLTTWQTFNTLRDGHVPCYFAVRAGNTAKLLQTTGGPDLPRVAKIEMAGEYPVAVLRFVDSDLPVQIEMSAFSPFAPLDTEMSSMPVAAFVFRIHNPTPKAQTVSLAALMQNPIGYDAAVQIAGNHHPNFGGNVNEAIKGDRYSGLLMRAEAGKPPTLDRDLHVYTSLPLGPLSAPPADRPARLHVESLENLPAADNLADPAHTVLFLEEPQNNLSADALRAARDAANAGASLVFSGRAMPLLETYAQATGGRPFDRAAARPDILFEDFEHGYENWTVEGTAFGPAPAQGTLMGQQPVSGYAGKGLVNSYYNGDDATGRLISRDFTIDRSFIRFLVGGGAHPTTQIRLLVDGKVVRAASGRNDERLLPAAWDVRDLKGRKAHIEIVDEQKGGWGHINVDQIEFADFPAGPEVMALLDELLPARFSGVRSEAGGLAFDSLTVRPDTRETTTAGLKLLTRPFGKGQVVLSAGPILPPNHAELSGARQRAYALLAGLTGARYDAPAGPLPTAPGYGSIAIGTSGPNTSVRERFADWREVWDAFAETGQVDGQALSSSPTPPGETINGAVASTVRVAPGKTIEAPFFLAWRYPNKYNGAGVWMGNHYATRWPDAQAVLSETAANFPAIREKTERFRKTFYDSTLPYWLLDALTSQMGIARHIGVVFRISNGDIFGWEGSNGCCQPTCTHVWGYMGTIARVFPELEREMRRIDFKHQQNPDGGVNNRTDVPSPPHPTGEHPFTDGHASTVLKAYREALNHPDDRWLREYWPYIRKAVNYLIARDAASSGGEPDGTITDDQWNTYDEALHGASTFIGTYYLAALRAGEEMARRIGDNATADRYHAIFEKGRDNLVKRCWNGEYFQQDLPDYAKGFGEFGPGCMSDQVLGQWWAHQLGLGYLLPKEHVQTALKSIFKYNWLPDHTNWRHNWRKFAGGKDKGLLVCTWPKGGRPAQPILYCDEVWTGIEYQVAAHMVYEGMIEEAFAIVKGARDRYDGVPRPPIPRNPWNEIECGGHYARAGSSWVLLLALSGFEYDGMTGVLRFAPRFRPDDFKSFFTGPEGWGSLRQTRHGNIQRNEVAVAHGRLTIVRLHLEPPAGAQKVRVSAAGKPLPASAQRVANGMLITLGSPVSVEQGRSLVVTFG